MITDGFSISICPVQEGRRGLGEWSGGSLQSSTQHFREKENPSVAWWRS